MWHCKDCDFKTIDSMEMGNHLDARDHNDYEWISNRRQSQEIHAS